MKDETCVKLTRYFYSVDERPSQVLDQELQKAQSIVEASISQSLLPNQYNALVCLVSDIVAGMAESPTAPFETSRLVVAVNQQMFQIAAASFHEFCFVNGQLNQRAWNKRRAEQFLFIHGKLLFD